MKTWDVFVSHASEDKEAFVRPLAVALRDLGVSVWYDEFSLRIGDSLSRSIDRGLASSRFGLVVISGAFLRKPWAEYELRGLVAREIQEDRVILPIWHGVTRAQVLAFSPPLADKVALDTTGLTAQDVSIRLLREVRPDIYASHPRAELQRLASGVAVQELQEEMERTRDELDAIKQEFSEYRCPFCAALLSGRIEVPNEYGSETRDIFECGYETEGGSTQRPCRKDPDFPHMEDYDFRVVEMPAAEGRWRWMCHAVGKTRMARLLSLPAGYGTTREQAEQYVRDRYEGFRAGQHGDWPPNSNPGSPTGVK